jgi:hypothetical protein
MSLLPAGSSLRGFLPDLDDLLESPAEYLGVGPVVIGPRRMYGLAAVFGLAGGAILAAYFLGQHDTERLALGAGLLVGAAIWFGWSLWARGDSLILHREGLEVRRHNLSVWCPWALFNTDGVAHSPEVDSPFVGITLPVVADIVPFIELRREESVIAHGAQVRTKRFVIAGRNELILLGRHEVQSKDIGDLLLHIGRALGHQLPRGAPPREAYQAEADEIRDPEPSGWITARATRLRFPRVCSGCGEPSTEVMRFEAWSRGGAAMGLMVPAASHEVAFDVPVCAACQAEVRSRQQRGAVRGLLAGSLLGPLALLLGEWLGGWGNGLSTFAALGIASAGALVGFMIGSALAFRPPVQVGGYSATSGTVRLRFRNPDYAAAVIALMREQREAP